MRQPLPAIEPLERLGREGWQALGAALRAAEVHSENLDKYRAIGNALFETLRVPIRHWHLARSEENTARLLRLFSFEDSLTPDEYAAAIDPALGGRLVDAELVREDAGGHLRCPFFLTMINELLVLSDYVRAGQDAVMGVSSTTAALVTAGHPPERVGRLLEIGCGAGAPGLFAARTAEHVVATDIAPRSLRMAQFNAWMNGIDNIEFRLGDMYEPVAGETFDWILGQPPFLPKPPESTDTLYLYGGELGNELLLRMVEGAPAHLKPGGTATFLADWPETDDTPAASHIESTVGRDDVSSLTILSFPSPIDDTCALFASHADPKLADDFAAETKRWREQFDSAGIRSIRPGIYVLRKTEAGKAWAAQFDLEYGWGLLTADDIATMIDARDLCATGGDAMFELAYEFAPGVTICRERPAVGGGEESVFLRTYHPSATVQAHLGNDALAVLEHVVRHPTALQGVEAVTKAFGADLTQVRDLAAGWLRTALLSGVLRIRRPVA